MKKLIIACFMFVAVSAVNADRAVAQNTIQRINAAVKNNRFGVYITSPEIRGMEENISERIGELKACGITDMFCHISTGDIESGRFGQTVAAFLHSASQNNIKAHVCIFASNEPYTRLSEATGAVTNWIAINNQFSNGGKISGLSLMLSPRTLNNAGTAGWSEDEYGAGKRNDMLMRQTLAIAEKAYNAAGAEMIEFSELIDWDYDSLVRSGKLSHGLTAEFLRVMDFVIVDPHSNDAEEILMRATAQVHGPYKEKSIRILLDNNEEEGGDIVSLIEQLYHVYSGYRQFGGAVIKNYTAFKNLISQ